MDLRNLNQLSPLDHTISPMNLCRFSFLATLFSPLSSTNRTGPKARLSTSSLRRTNDLLQPELLLHLC